MRVWLGTSGYSYKDWVGPVYPPGTKAPQMLAREFEGFAPAVEFRHHSWHRPEVPEWLRTHGLDLVSVDVPDLPALYPRGLVHSGPHVYVRFHSRNAAIWYASDKRRYDYDY